MTLDPSARHEHDPADLPPVDEVIQAAREASRHDASATSVPAAARPATAAAHAPPAVSAAHAGPAAHAADAHDEHAADHGDALGPVDTAQWAAGLIGVAVGLAVTACFVLATQGLGAF